MQKSIIAATLLLLLVMNLPLIAHAETQPVSSLAAIETTDQASALTARPDGESTNSNGIPYRTVTPDEFSGKINTLTGEVKQSLDKIVVPVSEVVVIILLIALVIGSLFGVKVVRKYALAGLGFSALALILYYSIPTIIGFINHVAKVLNG